jgi:uncharacterized protein (DUF302 family)
MTEFTISVTVDEPYESTVAAVRGELAAAGFGVLTEIDMRATLAAKLGVEVPSRLILGACRPELAHQALQADPRIAALLPCNVVVADVGNGQTRVDAFDPNVMTSFVSSPTLVAVAADARQRLARTLTALTNGAGGR